MALAGNELVFVLGAGASADAGLKMSRQMLDEVERRVELASGTGDSWQDYRELYYTLKGCLLYADGVRGKRSDDNSFNIERLVNAMRELQQNEDHVLYPFVASWNTRLRQHAGETFSQLAPFQRAILHELMTEWVHLKEPQKAAYFTGFREFQEEWQAPLHIYTLNYDLCVEEACGSAGFKVERGFTPSDEGRVWQWERMEEESISEAQLYLYKMHGSLDWRRVEGTGALTFESRPNNSEIDRLELIFGTNLKLSYIDPYLYFAYGLRKHTIDAKLIVLIGYSLGDDHVNEILKQALSREPSKRVLYVTKDDNQNAVAAQTAHVAAELGIAADRVKVETGGASEFLKHSLRKDFIDSLWGKDPEAPF